MARCCIVPNDVLPARVNQHVAIVRVKNENADPFFVYYTINSPYYKTQLLNLSQGGATREALTKTTIKNFQIPLPPLSIQIKIASILSAYDNLIGNNTRWIQILEEMAQRIYREWFVHFRFPGHENVKMVDSELGMIPEGWEIVTLDKNMNFQDGSQPSKEEWIYEEKKNYIRMIQIRDYQSDLHISFVKDSIKLQKCKPIDVMIGIYGASVGRICWGLDGAYNVALVKVLLKKSYYLEYLRSYLSDYHFQKLLIGMSGRTAQAGFNKTNLKSIRIPFPKKDNIIQKYFDYILPVRQLQLIIRAKNKILQNTRDLLLPKLISGKIDISDLDIGTT